MTRWRSLDLSYLKMSVMSQNSESSRAFRLCLYCISDAISIRTSWRNAAVALVLVLGLSAKSGNAQTITPIGPSELLTEEQQRLSSEYKLKNWFKRSDVIRIPPNAIKSSAINLKLPSGGASITYHREKDSEKHSRESIWLGSRKHKGQFIASERMLLTSHDGKITGRVVANNVGYMIYPLGDDLYELSEIDNSKAPIDHAPEALPSHESIEGNDAIQRRLAESTALSLQSNSDTVIRVMFAYTADALAKDPNIQGTINMAIADLNSSGTPTEQADFELAHTVQVTFNDIAIPPISLSNMISATFAMTSPSDGLMDELHGLRDDWNADIVVLLGDWGQYPCGHTDGYAKGPSQAFTSVDVQCAATFHTVVHEIGHVMGAYHQRGRNGFYTAPFGQTAYWQNTTVPFMTVAADRNGCTSCLRLSFYSNTHYVLLDWGPPITGWLTGSADENNAAHIASVANSYANYKTCPEGRVPPFCVDTEWTPHQDPDLPEFHFASTQSTSAPILTAYPDPFNPNTTITYSQPTSGPISIQVVDMLGRTVWSDKAMVRENESLSINLEAGSWSTGTYILRVESQTGIVSKTIRLLK